MDYRYLQRLADEDAPARIATQHQHCAFCGYDLFGSVSGRCPECGNVLDPRAMQDQSQELKSQKDEFEDAIRHVHFAWKILAFGVALFLLRITPILGPGGQGLDRALSFLCGFIALFLRLAVIRSGNLPTGQLTMAQVAVRDSFLSAVEIAGGIFLMATSVALR